MTTKSNFVVYQTNGGYYSIWNLSHNREVARIFESEEIAHKIANFMKNCEHSEL